MTKVTIEQWRMFHAVVKYGGFAQAAEKIYKSVSSVHYSVSKLENILNASLLKVEGRRTILTENGEKIFHKVEKLLSDAMLLEKYISDIHHENDFCIKMGVDDLFPVTILRQTLQSACQDTALQRLEINLLSSQDARYESDADLLLGRQKEIAGYTTHARFHVSYIAVISNQQRHFASAHAHAADLAQLTEIRLERSQNLSYASGATNFWVVDKLSSAIDLVCQGVGFAWLPEADVRHYLADGKLRQLHFRDIPDSHQLAFYLNVRADLVVKAVVNKLVRHFGIHDANALPLQSLTPLSQAS